MKIEIRQEENETNIKVLKKQIEMEDLVQSAINYLYDVFTNKNYVTDDDVKLFEIIYKD